MHHSILAQVPAAQLLLTRLRIQQVLNQMLGSLLLVWMARVEIVAAGFARPSLGTSCHLEKEAVDEGLSLSLCFPCLSEKKKKASH